ncbi:helix-turn-helix domain-containing protein [uncultured Catenibacterium sp.]|uniref:helix-turn-helix domain-containing protein n=1 Tax=uncultured Catenibacterium sp. TaxID=286142 RepID=UPI0025922B03|nr:helix-turn-helix transcriptional regulator [uncultured Catenibacterium sp.]
MTNKKIIGDNIRRILAENKKTGKPGVPHTQVELAAALGTSKQQVGSYVNGRHVMSAKALLKTAEALGVTQYELTGTAEDMKIVDIGRFVESRPVLLQIVDMIKNGVITEDQLQKVVEVITSLK